MATWRGVPSNDGLAIELPPVQQVLRSRRPPQVLELHENLQGLGFRVQGLGFGVEGSGFRDLGLGFRVYGAWPDLADVRVLREGRLVWARHRDDAPNHSPAFRALLSPQRRRVVITQLLR